MATFEITEHEKKLGVKIRSSVKGGVEIASMTRDGSLHRSFLGENVLPGLGDKIVTINGQDVSRALPDAVLAILKTALVDDRDVILGFVRHYSGIFLEPLDAQAYMNHKWNEVDALTQWTTLRVYAHAAVRASMNEAEMSYKARAAAIKEQEAIWRKEQIIEVHRVIFGEE